MCGELPALDRTYVGYHKASADEAATKKTEAAAMKADEAAVIGDLHLARYNY
jgi:hypothetical protein